MDAIIIIIYVAAILAFMYFVFIRPENKRKKEIDEMRKSVSVGDKITTIGGIIGVVVSDNEEKIVIETGKDRVRLELARWSISSKGKDSDEEAEQLDKQD